MKQQNERIQALAQHLVAEQEYSTLNEAYEVITESSYDDKMLEVGNREWLVVTDSEADELWNEDLDHYIDDCILPEVPEHFRSYFDDEKWKSDARMDGRGHSLNRYDGNEYEEDVNDTTYYIYRQN